MYRTPLCRTRKHEREGKSKALRLWLQRTLFGSPVCATRRKYQLPRSVDHRHRFVRFAIAPVSGAAGEIPSATEGRRYSGTNPSLIMPLDVSADWHYVGLP